MTQTTATLPHLTPHLTADLPGVGGRIKARPHDFFVEEIPAPHTEPTGDGEHLMLFIEKRGAATTDVIKRLAKLFRVNKSDIGYAGLKDKHAVTRQHLTVHLPGLASDGSQDGEILEPHRKHLENIKHTPITLLWADRTATKLRRGHLAGNRFVIIIRDVEPTHAPRALKILNELAKRGVPNFFGEQRFGYRDANHIIGKHLLCNQPQHALDAIFETDAPGEHDDLRAGRAAYRAKDYATALDHWPKPIKNERHLLDLLRQGLPPEQVVAQMDRTQKRFYINALQSAAFNRVLESRIKDQTFDKLLPGDLAFKHDNGSVFAVDEKTAEQENASPTGRAAPPDFTVSPSGPLWGGKMARTTGPLDTLEQAALTDFDITQNDLAQTSGSRRPLRIALKNPDLAAGVDEHGSYIKVSFDLPPGAYATIVLREIMKTAP